MQSSLKISLIYRSDSGSRRRTRSPSRNCPQPCSSRSAKVTGRRTTRRPGGWPKPTPARSVRHGDNGGLRSGGNGPLGQYVERTLTNSGVSELAGLGIQYHARLEDRAPEHGPAASLGPAARLEFISYRPRSSWSKCAHPGLTHSRTDCKLGNEGEARGLETAQFHATGQEPEPTENGLRTAVGRVIALGSRTGPWSEARVVAAPGDQPGPVPTT